jgi:hypothetical protein
MCFVASLRAGNTGTLLFDSLFVSLDGADRVAASSAVVRFAVRFMESAGPTFEVTHTLRVAGHQTPGAQVRLLLDADGSVDTLVVPKPDGARSMQAIVTATHLVTLAADGSTIAYLLLAERDTEEADANVAVESDDIVVRRPTRPTAPAAR